MGQEATPATGTSTTPATGTSTSPATGNPEPPATGNEPGGETKDWKAEADRFQAEARKWEDRSKANAGAAKELERVRRESMSEQERAVAEAAERARSEAVAEVVGKLGGRLVRSEIRAAVAGRLTAEQVDALVEHLDLSGFLSEAGDVDTSAVAAFAQRVAPEVSAPSSFPELGQGVRVAVARNGAPDPLLSALKGKLGITT